MKKFKHMDLVIQGSLLLANLAFLLSAKYEVAVWCYMISLSWQLASIAVHEAKFWFMRNKNRRFYHIATLLILFIGLLALIIPIWNAYIPIVCISLAMCIYYFVLCIWEWKQLHKRPLSILK